MSLRAAIIGFGIMGKAVANSLKTQHGVEVIAVADPGDAQRAAAEKDFGVPSTHAQWQAMLDAEKPDVVFIATPDWAHRDAVLGALQRGIHVYVEKPLTTDEGEARDIVRAVRESSLKLQVSYNHRWLAPYHAVKDKLKDGKLGAPIMFYARKNNPITVPTKMLPSWARESSPMWFQSSHDIDLVCWWAGEDTPVEAYCNGVKRVLKQTLGWDTYDAMQGQVRFASGAIATFESCWTLPEGHPAAPDSFMEVITERGQLHIDRKAEAVEMSSPEGIAWPRSFLNYPIFGEWTGAFPSCVRGFIRSVTEDLPTNVTALDGWKATAVLDALHKSAASGKPVAIPSPP